MYYRLSDIDGDVWILHLDNGHLYWRLLGENDTWMEDKRSFKELLKDIEQTNPKCEMVTLTKEEAFIELL